ncbi:MAG: hypothetical protein Q8S53_07155 [Brevundimonas sp.]|uniref:hypothetical protein n=1 Tax=Brevundimonas sp. TaxID=1871086 RepID=UPI00273426A9|nr:hypothetical protein [Brevundimonas sp.]MDP3378127.1 hypothetical protein [Brevundimonas sp.]
MNDRGLNHLSEDATGFGQAEWRTLRDSLIRPRELLEAYMVQGPDGGGGHYARPLRLYLTLCGILMLVLFLKGGAGFYITGLPADVLDPLIEASGKSRELFVADADNWMSLTMVPVLLAFYALISAPLLRWWDPEDLGWRKAFRATFAFLNALTLVTLPISWFAYDVATSGYWALFLSTASIVIFMRMGWGRWFTAPLAGFAKAVALTIGIQIFGGIGLLPVVAIGLMAATYAP